MKIINASAVIEYHTPNLEEEIERAGRVCYKSEGHITGFSAYGFIRRMLHSKHESVLEHGSITVRIVCDRGVSHEIVRHRLCSFSQESTRYCNYSKDKFDGQLAFIDIRGGFPDMPDGRYNSWKLLCEFAEDTYLDMVTRGATPQEARAVLPNSLKTEIVVTANPREWRWIFLKRCDKAAHPQMREIMIPLLREFSTKWPALFEDVVSTTGGCLL